MTYRERKERRAERLETWSVANSLKSDARFDGARASVAMIPFGQPILVGHHSEGRHRAALDRHDSNMRKACELQDKAADQASRAKGIANQLETSIYSDDPDAIERLTERLTELEAKREQMKAENSAYRKAHSAELKGLSVYGRSQAMPWPSYSLQNLGGNITRTRQRIAQLSGKPAPDVADLPEDADPLTRAGLTVTAGMTTPSRPGKQPRPVWTVGGATANHRAMLADIGGTWYRGAYSFWEDPTDDITEALSNA